MRRYVENDLKSGNDYGNSFKVYVLKVFSLARTRSDTEYCGVISYVMNSFDFAYLKTEYYTVVDSHYVVVELDSTVKVNHVAQWLPIQPIEGEMDVRIAQQLFPEVIGGFTYNPSGMLLCWTKNGAAGWDAYYDMADDIPPVQDILRTLSPHKRPGYH